MLHAIRRLLPLAWALAWTACAGEPDPGGPEPQRPGPPGARWDAVEMLRESLARPRHPSDGGGRAWLEPEDGGERPRAQVGRPGRFVVVYEVGPLGIAQGGAIHFQVSPFWDWSTPQVEVPGAPGYTRVEALGDDIQLEVRTLDQQLLGIDVAGRALVEGDRIRIVYGEGEIGALADRFAERNSRFWIAVDGDGDGVRTFLPDSPGVDVAAGSPARLVLTLPSTARPDGPVRLTLAVLDGGGSTGTAFEGVIELVEVPAGLELPPRVTLEAADAGRKTLTFAAREPGVYRLRARTADGLEAESNPMLVSAESPRVLWADLHGHSALSDGTGTPEDYFRYARDVAALDVSALTDHDHWGILPLDAHPEMWAEIVEQTRRFHEPGRFVTLLGYEWTSWIHGHRHVLYFEDEGEVYSSIDPRYESPRQLWDALEGLPALTFAHHSAGGPIPTNWEFAPDPVFEPVTEIVSVHGSSEAADSPHVIYQAQPGNFVRDVLTRGYQLGFIGSGDSHDGHPGLAQLASPSGGMAAILSEDLTREAVLAALRERRVYATNGPRILLRAALGLHRMGSIVPVPESGSLTEELVVQAIAPAPIARVDLVRSGAVVDSFEADGLRSLLLQHTIADLRSGEYLYVRVVQEDEGAAWSSPIFVE
jgi:hypothetical protein